MSTRILLVEDDAAIRFALRDYLEGAGYGVVEAESCATAERAFEAHLPAVVISDYRLPDGNALELLPKLRAINANAPIILLTGHGSVELAVEAMRQGADDFLTKPIALPALAVVIERALDRQRERQQQLVRLMTQRRTALDPFLGTSAAIRKLQDQAQRIVGADRPVLILGETGSGKGVLTRWLHEHGPRAKEAFVDLNCASLPRELLESELFGHEKGAFTGATTTKPGLAELAHHGTLFLDEIGDLELSLQPKLLKVLEDQTIRRVGAVRDRQVDIRLIAATHQDLPGCVAEGTFRSDLYFRISTLPITVPALRDRKEDIAPLAFHILQRLSNELGRPSIELAADALPALEGYRWPGNVRELRNVLERAVLLKGEGQVGAADLSFEPLQSGRRPSGPDYGEATLEEVQRQHILRVLESVNGRVDAAAARLDIPRSTLYQRLRAMQIAVPRGSRGPKPGDDDDAEQ